MPLCAAPAAPLQRAYGIRKRARLRKRICGGLGIRAIRGAKVRERAGRPQPLAPQHLAQRVHLFPALAAAVHARIDSEMRLNAPAKMRVFAIDGGLRQIPGQKKREILRRRISQNQDQALHATLAQFHSFPHRSHAKRPHAQAVQFPGHG